MLSVFDSRELQAVTLAMKTADRDLRNRINRSVRETMNPVWRAQVAAHATRHTDTVVIAKGARIKAGNPPVALAAQSRRALRGGLVPAQQWQGFEFGASSQAVAHTYTRRSPKGRVHKVTRRTKRQLPPRIRAGRVAYPALADLLPRAWSLVTQLVVKVYAEAGEGRRV